MTVVRNDLFDPKIRCVRGRSRFVECCWYVVKQLFFLSSAPWPNQLKVALLRAFGAVVGKGVVIKPRVNIHLPWKLSLGDYVWLGEEVFILNLEPVDIGSHVCISQRVFLCTGNHDYRTISMEYRNEPIAVGAGAWVGAQAFIGPGVCIGVEAVICAGSVVSGAVRAQMVYAGNPCREVGNRWKSSERHSLGY